MAQHAKILMVCLGNICRSPLAEGLLRSKLDFTRFTVESAGTYGGHAGSPPDSRSIAVASKNNLDITAQRSRKFRVQDFEEFDLIYAMDGSNYRDLVALAPTSVDADKVKLILETIFPGEHLDVPDPYHGGSQGFDNVYKMLDKATTIIAQELQKDIEY